jgi:hypothetical protein
MASVVVAVWTHDELDGAKLRALELAGRLNGPAFVTAFERELRPWELVPAALRAAADAAEHEGPPVLAFPPEMA